MSKFLKIMDDQMLKWVAELDELNRRKTNTDKAIQQLEQCIENARKLGEILKEVKPQG